MTKKRKKTRSAGVKDMAADSWEKLEQLFAARVAMVLNAMQIPTHDDVQELAARVAQLTRQVEKLSGKPAPAKTKATSRKTPRKKATTRKKRARKTGSGK